MHLSRASGAKVASLGSEYMRNMIEGFADRLLAMADNELILAHRNSEWTGHAPILEEDIAIANIAQDELGHATLYYALHAACVGADPETHGDTLVYGRTEDAWRNAPMFELPRGDWAFTLLRQYLFDQFEQVLLSHTIASGHAPLAAVAAKIAREERYHLLHAEAWIKRLALGTEESTRRTQQALDVLWPLSAGLFISTAFDDALAAASLLPHPATLHTMWHDKVCAFLSRCKLQFDPAMLAPPVAGGHTQHLTSLLLDLQTVNQLDPKAQW